MTERDLLLKELAVARDLRTLARLAEDTYAERVTSAWVRFLQLELGQ